MQVIVMCGGFGTRLRPLTYAVPKPMIPVANRPVLEYTIELLKIHRINDIIVNLHFKPEMIKNYFKDGKKWGVDITYSHERKPLGTAGGIKKIENLLKKETFLVMSGDGLTDINLTELIKFHKEKGGVVTIVLKEVSAKLEYGIAAVGKNSQITHFLEKPSWGEVFHGMNTGINTGIYVLEPEIFKYIPRNKELDFAKNLFPLLLRKKKKIFGYFTNDYWCDIGNLQQYRMSHRDILEGIIKVKIEGEWVSGRHRKGVGRCSKAWIDEGCEIDPSALISGPLIIGKNCRVKRNVRISGATVLGNNCFVDEGAVLYDCIIWDNGYIGKDVRIENCIIGKNARVIESISMFGGIVQIE